MKFVVNILLILWLSFLSAPTFIGCIADLSNLEITYNVIEEENAKETERNFAEEVYEEFFLNTSIPFLIALKLHKNKLLYGANKNTLPIYKDVYTPPPEMV